jgi:hypothetical protein
MRTTATTIRANEGAPPAVRIRDSYIAYVSLEASQPFDRRLQSLKKLLFNLPVQ